MRTSWTLAWAVALASCARASGEPQAERVARWSFEAGLPADFAVRFRADDGYAGEPAIEALALRPHVIAIAGDAPRELGRRALEVTLPARAMALVHTPVVRVGPGAHALSVFVRGGPVTLRLRESVASGGRACGAKDRVLGERDVAAAAKGWTRSVLIAHGEGALFGEIEAHGPRAIAIDGIQIEPGEAPGAFAAPIEIDAIVNGDKGSSVIDPGERARIDLELSRPIAAGERIEVTAIDPRGEPIPIEPIDSQSLAWVARPSRLGPHRVHVALRASDGRVLAEADRTFAVLPEPAPISAERSRFGTHTRLDPRHLALAARLGFRWLRLHDASLVGQWLVAEPEPRRFRWFDESIDRARRMGFAILGVLEGTPRWASSAPPSTGWYEARAFPPRDPAAWRRYVGAAVAHYRGRVDAWEVWNEPYFDAFWRAPPEAYRALLADAIAAAHAASPAVTVLASGCGQASCRPWQAIALGPLAPIERAAIADRPIDDSHDRLAAQGPHAIAFHAYDFRLVAADEDLAARVAAERALLGPSVRLWDTEGAAPGAVGSSLPSAAPGAFTADPERDGAAFVRWAVEGFAAGVERAFAYALVESEFANDSDLALLDPDGAPRPAACALAVLSARLRDLRFLRSERRGPWTARVFGDARGELAIAIADGLGALTVAAPGARDVFGNPLAPGARARAVYLEAPDRPSLDRLLDTRLGD